MNDDDEPEDMSSRAFRGSVFTSNFKSARQLNAYRREKYEMVGIRLARNDATYQHLVGGTEPESDWIGALPVYAGKRVGFRLAHDKEDE